MTTTNGPSPDRRDPRADEYVILLSDEDDAPVRPSPLPLRPSEPDKSMDRFRLNRAKQYVRDVPEEQIPQLRETPRIRRWEAEARKEGILVTARKDLLRVLAVRLPAPVPDDIAAQAAAASDTALLERWFEAALHANTYEEFRHLTQTSPPPGS